MQDMQLHTVQLCGADSAGAAAAAAGDALKSVVSLKLHSWRVTPAPLAVLLQSPPPPPPPSLPPSSSAWCYVRQHPALPRSTHPNSMCVLRNFMINGSGDDRGLRDGSDADE
jgi:hypothetical protein